MLHLYSLSVALMLSTLLLGIRAIPLEYQLSPAYTNHTVVTRRWCPPDSQFCCHRLYDRERTRERELLRDYLGLNIPFDDHLVGVRCNQIQALPATDQKCESPIVCCTGGREYLGLVNTYCSPLELDESLVG
ncbi:hypothetical protein BDV93DRAFT_523265 [Ceratobasidium sp. AG-I]|nr:hypothetical protein BDV93DRAFT_523265 [Ceratobasidium sp. AG-I]